MKELSICIVNYNVIDLLRQCLDSIYKNTKNINFEIIVVDNGSTDGSQQMVAKEFPAVILIKNRGNPNLIKAYNQALRKSSGEFVVTMNSDIIIHPRAFLISIKFLLNHPNVGTLSVKHVSPDGSTQKTCQKYTNPFQEFLHSNLFMNKFYRSNTLKKIHYTSWSRNTSRYVDITSNACLIAPRKPFEQFNWYDERFLLFFAENDLCLRMQKAGYKNYYLADVKITHIKGPSIKLLKSRKANAIYEHDMLAYYKKYFGFSGWLFLFLTIKPNRIYYFL